MSKSYLDALDAMMAKADADTGTDTDTGTGTDAEKAQGRIVREGKYWKKAAKEGKVPCFYTTGKGRMQLSMQVPKGSIIPVSDFPEEIQPDFRKPESVLDFLAKVGEWMVSRYDVDATTIDAYLVHVPKELEAEAQRRFAEIKFGGRGAKTREAQAKLAMVPGKADTREALQLKLDLLDQMGFNVLTLNSKGWQGGAIWYTAGLSEPNRSGKPKGLMSRIRDDL